MIPFFDSSTPPSIPWTYKVQTVCITGEPNPSAEAAYSLLVDKIRNAYEDNAGQVVVLYLQCFFRAGNFEFIAVIAQMAEPTASITLIGPGSRIGS